MDFETVTPGHLDETDLDTLEFGVVRMDREGIVVEYNAAESRISGLSKDRVVGRAFFKEVGVCMRNFMVSDKYDEPGDLDELVEYVLTVRMDPTPVTLRLLKKDQSEFAYLLVQPR